jgi:hypothetical protein
MEHWMKITIVVGVALSIVTAPTAVADAPPMPGIEIEGETSSCTAGFAAQGADGFYLLTSGHCDAHDGAEWTYGDDAPLGVITVSEKDDDANLDAALIQLEPELGPPVGNIAGRYPVSGFLDGSQLEVGMPICKVGATTGETCGEITSVDGDEVETSVFSLHGDRGSPGFVKNPDGTVSAVGLLSGSPDGDDYTTYFILLGPLLGKWGLNLVG